MHFDCLGMQFLTNILDSWRNRDAGCRAAILHAILSSVVARFCHQRDPPKKAITRFRSTPVSEVLLSLFLQHNKPDCEDQRDKIFGLHSLTTICCKIAVAVDYSSTWRQTLATIVLHQILHHHFYSYPTVCHRAHLSGELKAIRRSMINWK